MADIKVRYLDSQMPKLNVIDNGDWIDLRVVSAVAVLNTEYEIKAGFDLSRHNNWNSRSKIHYRKDDVIVCRLGVSMELPVGMKAKIIPRSSLFKNHGLMLANSVGAIDYSYRGDDDEWILMLYATRDGSLEKYERIAQFDVVPSPQFTFEEVKKLSDQSRGGFGTTGII